MMNSSFNSTIILLSFFLLVDIIKVLGFHYAPPNILQGQQRISSQQAMIISTTHQKKSIPISLFLRNKGRSSSSSTTILFAKKTKKKNKKKVKVVSAAGGGFSGGGFSGGAAKTTPLAKKKENNNDDEDYAIFPPLEPNVKDTLIPAGVIYSKEPKDLSTEIYERLAGIYGFPNFNFLPPIEEEKQEEGLSSSSDDSSLFTDLLATTPTTKTQSNNDVTNVLSLLEDTTTTTTMTMTKQETTTKKSSSSSVGIVESSIRKVPVFEKFRVLHLDPLVIEIVDFFTEDECNKYQELHTNQRGIQSQTVGKDVSSKSSRTSTTWYHCYKDVPEFTSKALRLLGLYDLRYLEEVQTVRYRNGEKFTWHLDALSPTEMDTAGQRIGTLLVYLTDIPNGGSTMFRDLNFVDGQRLRVQPKRGNALLFFPSAGGIPNTPFDIRTLHCGEEVVTSLGEEEKEKWIVQCWIRSNPSYQVTTPPNNSHTDDDTITSIKNYCN